MALMTFQQRLDKDIAEQVTIPKALAVSRGYVCEILASDDRMIEVVHNRISRDVWKTHLLANEFFFGCDIAQAIERLTITSPYFNKRLKLRHFRKQIEELIKNYILEKCSK